MTTLEPVVTVRVARVTAMPAMRGSVSVTLHVRRGSHTFPEVQLCIGDEVAVYG